LEKGTAVGQGKDVLRNVLAIVGSKHDDVLLGDEQDNKIYGSLESSFDQSRWGSDVIKGRGGDDRLRSVLCGLNTEESCKFSFPSPGDDELYGGKGADYLQLLSSSLGTGGPGTDLLWLYGDEITAQGSEGDDSIAIRAAGDSHLLGGIGWDELHFSHLAWVNAKVDLLAGEGSNNDGSYFTVAGVEQVRGGGRADTIYGDDRRNVLLGGNGADDIQGRGGDDDLDGDAGNDSLRGDEGFDTCFEGEDVDCEVTDPP
jgi:Ca2+-binding RTX toxin-like protein